MYRNGFFEKFWTISKMQKHNKGEKGAGQVVREEKNPERPV